MLRGVIVAIAVLFSVAANAQDLTVFGFELGKPLSLPECPATRTPVGATKFYEEIPAYTCFQEPRKFNGYGIPARMVVFGKSEAPPFVRYWRFVALEHGGVLIGVRFGTNGASSQDLVISQLTAKYGKPSSTSTRVVQNLMGAQFNAIIAVWSGGSVDVTYDGVTGEIDRGQVTIDLPQATALRRSWQNLGHESERKL
jgi:hypothetical protein